MPHASRVRDPSQPPDRQERRAPASPASVPVQLLSLQATAGNAAVTRLVQQAAAAPPVPVAPAARSSATQLEEDWNNPAYARSREKFAGSGRPAGTPKERYLKLAPLYEAHGIDRPLKWADENITSVTFFGSTTPAHVSLKTALEAAEADLRAQGHTQKPFRSCWAFNPRTTSKGGWSNHADGKAIDIDADANPHFTNLRQKKIINALTGMDVTAANPGATQGMTAYEAMVEMSKRFDERFSPEGMEKRISELEAEEERLAAEVAEIRSEIAALPRSAHKKGRLTAEERAKAKEVAQRTKELTAALKAKHAQVGKAQERQDLLEAEKARFAEVGAEADAQRRKIADLLEQIEALEQQRGALEDQIEAQETALEDDGGAPVTKEARRAKAAVDRAARAKIRKDRLALAGLNRSRRSKVKAIAAAEGKIDTLHRWGDKGLMDLEPHLVTALKKAGLSWGGEWAGSKDLMHFEVR